MKVRVAPLAKLSRPRLHDAVPRERLFARLDVLREHSTIWISGPPGAGKTTLVASYLDDRDIDAVWYQIDAGDLDISTYFFYLGEAAKHLAPDQPALALLTPEYLPDLPGFARRWFRQFFTILTAPSLLVLDNYQEACGPQMDALLGSALADVPRGVTVVVISRSQPSDVFARHLAHGEMTVLGWDELKLTIEEAMAVASARGVSSPATVNAVFGQCDGWVAGLTLMLERVRNTKSVSILRDRDSLETIFAYFAGLVFEVLPDTTKRDLVLCSYLPSVSRTQAQALTGNPEADLLLDQLYRRHLFTNRRGESDLVYEFHALFRSFLRMRAIQLLTPEQRLRALRDAAKLLITSGQITDALSLYAETQDWNCIEAAILEHAPAVLGQGRGQTVRDWIALLPADYVDSAPWIQYWLGAALAPHDQQRSRAIQTRAYEKLRERNDFAGQVATASGVVDTYFFSFSGYAGLKEWMQKIAELLQQPERFSSRQQRLQACGSYLLAVFFGDGTHPDIAENVAEIQRLIREPLDSNLRMRAGTFLVTYAGAILHPALVRDDLELLDGLAVEPSVTPLRQAQWHSRYAFLCYELGDFELAAARISIAQRLCSEHGLRAPVSLLNQFQVFVSTAQGDSRKARLVIDQWQRLLSPDRPVERSQWNIGRLVAQMRSEEGKAEWPEIAREIASQMDATGQTWIRVAHRIPGAYALTECGEYETVKRWLAELRAMISGSCFARYERDALCIEAYLALHEDEPERARDRIRRALRLTLEEAIPLNLAQSPRAIRRMLSFALHEDIEPDVARSLATQYRLSLDVAEASTHAQPIQVVTLGRFEIRKDGRALAHKGKAQQRPLGLLKLLVAQGGNGVPVSACAEALWPDSEGDLGANACKVALYRLRKLLGYESAISIRHGALFIDPDICWIDARAFEEKSERAERYRLAQEMELFETLAKEALGLYQGLFLPAEEPQPWLVVARDRLAHKARQLIIAFGRHLEDTDRIPQACTVYESGLLIDTLSEALYQRHMSAYLRTGQYAEAMKVFRRCREMLSIVLGIPPSDETLALFRQAQEQARLVDHR